MYIYFLDESGNSKKWKNDIKNQPYMVWAAVGYKADDIKDLYTMVNKKLFNNDIESITKYEEIKAKDIKTGSFKGEQINDSVRNLFRQVYLEDALNKSINFISVIDKKAHLGKYKEKATNPSFWGLRFIVERIAKYHKKSENLKDNEDRFFILVLDQDKVNEDKQNQFLNNIKNYGSSGTFMPGTPIERRFNLEVDNLLDFYFTNDRTCIGVKVADFLAYTFQRNIRTGVDLKNQYIKKLIPKLAKDDLGSVMGVGLKIFP